MSTNPFPASWRRARRSLTMLVTAGLAFAVISTAADAGRKPTPPPPPPPPPPATPVTYSGDAQVVGVGLHLLSLNLLGQSLDIPIAVELGRAGPLPSTGGYLTADLLTIGDPSPIQLLLTANAVHALTSGNGFEAYSQAYVADVNLGLGPVLPTTLAIQATVLESNAAASCKGTGGAAVSGSSQVAGLKINGTVIPVTGTPNQTIDLSPIAKIVINEQIKATTASSGSITVNALHVYVLPPGGPLSLAGVLTGDVIISRAHADIGNCAAAPPPCEATNTCPTCESMGTCPPCAVDDFVTGGGKVNGGMVTFSTHGGRKGTELRSGHLNVVDKSTGQKINTGDLFGYRDPTPTSTTRELNFYCAAGNGVCTVTETDKGEPGTSDRWHLDAHGYSAGSLSSAISSGNIQLHEPRGCKDKSGSGSTGGGGSTKGPKGK
jgi:hypothetical protein